MFIRSQVVRNLVVLAAVASLAASQPVLSHGSTWKKLAPATSPSLRSDPAMAYDPVSKKIVLFGGFGASGDLNDTWTFDGTTWTEVKTAVAPPVRAATTMAFDKYAHKLVIFGGFNFGAQKISAGHVGLGRP